MCWKKVDAYDADNVTGVMLVKTDRGFVCLQYWEEGGWEISRMLADAYDVDIMIGAMVVDTQRVC